MWEREDGSLDHGVTVGRVGTRIQKFLDKLQAMKMSVEGWDLENVQSVNR